MAATAAEWTCDECGRCGSSERSSEGQKQLQGAVSARATLQLLSIWWKEGRKQHNNTESQSRSDIVRCIGASYPPSPPLSLPSCRRISVSNSHFPTQLCIMPPLRVLPAGVQLRLLAGAKKCAGQSPLLSSRSGAPLHRPQHCIRYLSHRSTTTLSTQPTPSSTSLSSPHRPSSANDVPPADLGLSPPVSQRTIRVVLAVVVATASVVFFRYIATDDTPPHKPTTPRNISPATPLTSPASSTSPASASIIPSIVDAIGNTPLVELQSLSRLTGRRILAKLENLNPAGSVKDRTALFLIRAIDSERRQRWKEEGREAVEGGGVYGTIIEATGGNTGVALAMLAPLFNYSCLFTYPDYITPNKVQYMATLGATLLPAPAVPFSSPQHFYNVARHLAQVTPDSYWTNQFENEANYTAHYTTTGPEIWRQTGGRIRAFVCAAGTGGTMAGVSAYLKQCDGSVKCVLIDPPNSGLYSHYTDGGWQGRQTDVAGGVVEGIGIYRLTANMRHAVVDGVMAGLEREAVEMAWWLLKEEGLCVGASAALNVCGAVKAARTMSEGDMVVTIICDGGAAYANRLYNPEWLKERSLEHVMQKRDNKSLDWIS